LIWEKMLEIKTTMGFYRLGKKEAPVETGAVYQN
jgi:hypothetical protein